MSYSLILQVIDNDDEFEEDPCLGTLGANLILDAGMKKEGVDALYRDVVTALIEKGFII